MSESNTSINLPPLPSLEGRGSNLCDQETLEHTLKFVYEQRPDLFLRILEQEKTGLDHERALAKEFRDFIRDEAKVIKAVPANMIFFEARRSVRRMYGIPLSYIPNLDILATGDLNQSAKNVKDGAMT